MPFPHGLPLLLADADDDCAATFALLDELATTEDAALLLLNWIEDDSDDTDELMAEETLLADEHIPLTHLQLQVVASRTHFGPATGFPPGQI